MWKVKIVIDSKVHNKIVDTTVTFHPFYTYRNLYKDILILMEEKWGSEFNMNTRMVFSLYEYDYMIIVKEWDTQVINDSNIYVMIEESDKVYYALYNTRKENIFTGESIDHVYSYINKYLNQINSDYLYLYLLNEMGMKMKLLDVIVNKNKIYNDLITRLVKNYGWYK